MGWEREFSFKIYVRKSLIRRGSRAYGGRLLGIDCRACMSMFRSIHQSKGGGAWYTRVVSFDAYLWGMGRVAVANLLLRSICFRRTSGVVVVAWFWRVGR